MQSKQTISSYHESQSVSQQKKVPWACHQHHHIRQCQQCDYSVLPLQQWVPWGCHLHLWQHCRHGSLTLKLSLVYLSPNIRNVWWDLYYICFKAATAVRSPNSSSSTSVVASEDTTVSIAFISDSNSHWEARFHICQCSEIVTIITDWAFYNSCI